MIRLHDSLSSGNGYKVRLLLAQLGIPFERIEYNLEDSESRTPQFLENVNPNGTIPVLEIKDGRFIPESNAILCYLAEGTRFISDDPFERAQTLRWMFFELESHAANIASPRYWITHGLEMTEERRASLEPKRTRGYSALGVMEDHLKDREFLVADRYSVADIALYVYTHVAHEGGFDLENFPMVRAWLDRIAAQPDHIPMTQG